MLPTPSHWMDRYGVWITPEVIRGWPPVTVNAEAVILDVSNRSNTDIFRILVVFSFQAHAYLESCGKFLSLSCTHTYRDLCQHAISYTHVPQ